MTIIKEPQNYDVLDICNFKFDYHKLRTDLLEPEWLEELSRVITLGANKYGDRNWKKVSKERYVAALLRHFIDYRKGHTMNIEEDKVGNQYTLFSMAQIAINALFILSLDIEEQRQGVNK